MSEDIDVFVICGASNNIAPGQAKAFMLQRIDETGQKRPFPIFIMHTAANGFIGYVNECPHKGSLLNSAVGGFFSQDRKSFECGLHGSRFDMGTGACIDGPCMGQSLQPVALAVIDGDICLCGVKLATDGDDEGDEGEEQSPGLLISSD